jgi:hypothetical protein
MSLQSEETLLARYLAERVIGRASGATANECSVNPPRDVYFVGSLRPAYTSPERTSRRQPFLDDLLSKLSPHAFGAEFALEALLATPRLKVTLDWTCYYRVFPDLEEQRRHQRYGVNEAAISTASTAIEPVGPAPDGVETDEPSPRRRRAVTDVFFRRYRAIRCTCTAILRLSFTNRECSVELDELRAATRSELDRARALVLADPMHLRLGRDPEAQVRIPTTALADEASYDAFRATLPHSVLPPWSWAIAAEARRARDQQCAVFLTATNDSQIDERSWHTDGFFFDTRLTFEIADGRFAPFMLETSPEGFRFERRVWGRGFNCGVTYEAPAGGPGRLQTTNAPRHEQQRYNTRTDPPAPFAELARDPVPTLESVRQAMLAYRKVWDAEASRYAAEDPDWANAHSEEYEEDRRRFEGELDRFTRGTELVRKDADIRLAFQLTNEAFRRSGSSTGKTAWRLFQLVFLVTQLPGFNALRHGKDDEDRSVVDIIYFPTGGGKTEAYLATIVFHCFYDRLRGKTGGVTAWTRFPLRLLTLQQMQRVADVIGAAEVVRRQHRDPRLSGTSVDGFAVGYFVGQEATPNEITPPRDRDRGDPEPNWSIANDPVERQRWKKLVRCPSCSTPTIDVDFDSKSVRVLHRCRNKDCAFPGGVVPVYIVDNEIYRYLPCVVVGTIDKLAGLGNQRKLSMVLGTVTGRCSHHNYYSHKCCQKDCVDPKRLRPGPPAGISGPTLFVQDELHLLKEGLGTFDGHYETFLQALLRRTGLLSPVKIIASSATIEAFERQVTHLYGRTARVFPGQGPTLRSSFYAKTEDHPQRIYIGILPHNKTIFNAVLEIIQYYHEEIAALAAANQGPNPFGGRTSPGGTQWRTLLDPYLTSLTYFSAIREMSGIRTDLESHVSFELEASGCAPLRIAELSGSTSTDSVTRILEQLERKEDPESPNAVLATSMISHGVDVDRFNCMLFYGMPRATAEYIQASSRVGRKHVGLVLTCLKPARERDQSHFIYYEKYHEFMGRLVEPVAINRWSKFSILRTIPGLFMGVLLQELANRLGGDNPNRLYMADYVKRMIGERRITESDFLDILQEAYLVSTPGPGPAAFAAEIPRRVSMFLHQIVSASAQSTFVSEAIHPPPMRSLRDVDEQIAIELDTDGSNWGSRMGGQ